MVEVDKEYASKGVAGAGLGSALRELRSAFCKTVAGICLEARGLAGASPIIL